MIEYIDYDYIVEEDRRDRHISVRLYDIVCSIFVLKMEQPKAL